MFAKSIIQEHYSDTRLSPELQKRLEKFAVADLIGLTFSFIKQNFKEGFLFPYLWMLLVGFLQAIVMVLAALAILLAFGWNKFLTTEFQSDPSQLAWSIFYLILVLLIISIPFALFIYYIQLRQVYLLNHKSLRGIWFIDKSMGEVFWKTILARILILLISLPAYLVGFALMFIGTANFINFSTTLGQTPTETLGIFEPFGGSPVVGLLAVFAGFIIAVVWELVLAGLVGLFEQLIVQENLGAWQSIKKSFRISKIYYFLNVLRWLLFAFVLFGVSMVANLVGEILNRILSFSLSFGDGSQLNWEFGVTVVIIVLVGIAINLIIDFIITSLTLSFDYLAFYNFRMATLRQVEGEVETSDFGKEVQKV